MGAAEVETRTTPQRVVIYTRISSDEDGKAAGVGRQKDDCLRRVEREDGWRVVKIFTENDVGASRKSRKKRPQYAEMLAMVALGEVDVILAYSNSRLTRRLKEFGDLLDLHERTGVLIRTIVSGDDDLGTAHGQMVANIKASVDEAEANIISERVLRSVKERVSAGEWLGGPRPFGWRATQVVYKNRIKLIFNELDDLEAKMVAAAIKHVIEGGSVSEILRLWTFCELETASGGKVWRHVGVNRILTRPRNAGILEYRGVIQPDAKVPWEPICTADDLAKVRAVILDPNRSKGPGGTPKHLLSGIPVCGKCGSVLKSGAVRSRGKTYRMYRCSGPGCGLAMKIEALDRVVVRHVLREYLHGPTNRFEVARSEARHLLAQTNRELASILAERREVEQAINERLTSLAGMRPTLTRLSQSERDLRQELERHYREDAHASMLASVAAVWHPGGDVPKYPDVVAKDGTVKVTFAMAHPEVAAELDAIAKEPDGKRGVSIAEALIGMAGRWAAMALDQRRKLIKALFIVTVQPGRGEDRVQITDA